MPKKPHNRTPRFTRVEDPPAIELTERDLTILRHVGAHRFLTSRQITRLAASTPQPVVRRLNRLFHHGYLDRPRAQIDYFHRGGSQPLVYGLGRRGLPVVYPEGDDRPRIDNLHVGRLHLQHTVLIAEVLIAI
ncbi:MAG: replication-relaxation family protein, partial [Verrucomicrobiales bacterium]|nr:replication-relaxation family protein [Verrucomicrobiales bacterium]